ncbi:alpha-tubulin N-acetyltransferase 1 [Heptranchias perlo]|uniref:alpha-tubulin N-acetyltransferase 1 n=1 Tax=Heptranchias perlo TaxID=212740 RepID=UPI00355A110A
MEFAFDINPLFPERITVLDHHLQLGRRANCSKADLEHQLATVLDKMGETSAKAQLLSAPITSASRMRINRHRLYLLKDGLANHGKGAAIGFLKVGHKNLFVLDGRGAHNEMEPLCVLDFYVHLSLQRHGYGKELFDYMIQYEGIKPQHLAIDRPSSKFLCFLRKHYGLAATIPQVNNFVVFESFFRDRQTRGGRLIHRIIPKKEEQDIKPYSITVRDGAPEDQELPWPFNQSPSLTRSNSLGCSPHRQQGRPLLGQQEALRHVRVVHPRVLNGARETDDPTAQRRRTSTPEQQGMVAMGNMYSRYSKNRSQSPDCMAEKSRAAGSDQNAFGRTEQLELGATESPPSEPEPQTQHVPPLDLGGLRGDRAWPTRDSPPPAPGVQKPVPGQGAENEPAPPEEAAPGGGANGASGRRDPLPSEPTPRDAGAGLGKTAGGPRSNGKDPVERPLPEQKAAQPPALSSGKQRSGAVSWAELGVPVNAQWIRHKHEFRNTRPW